MLVYKKVIQFPLVGFGKADLRRTQDLINGNLDMYTLDSAHLMLKQEHGTVICIKMEDGEPETTWEKIRRYFTKRDAGFEVRLIPQEKEESNKEFDERIKIGVQRYSVLYRRLRGELAEQTRVKLPKPHDDGNFDLAILLFKRHLDPEQTLHRVELANALNTNTDHRY